LRSVAPFGDATHVPAIIAPGQFDAVANGLAVQRDDTVGSVRMVYTAQPQYQQAAAAIVATAGLIDGYLHTSAGLLPIEASAQGGHVGRATCRFATRLLTGYAIQQLSISASSTVRGKHLVRSVFLDFADRFQKRDLAHGPTRA